LPLNMDDETRSMVIKILSSLRKKVVLNFYEPNGECMYCKETIEILDMLHGFNKNIIYNVYSEEEGREKGFDLFPVLTVGRDNVRFLGVPAGYEFGTLLSDIVEVGNGLNGLDEKYQRYVKEIDKPVRIMVFVTPSCPYCPKAVQVVHRMAMLNENIIGEMVEALEFRELAEKYGVYAVPKQVFMVDGEDRFMFEGIAPVVFYVAGLYDCLKIGIPDELMHVIKNIKIDKSTLSKV